MECNVRSTYSIPRWAHLSSFCQLGWSGSSSVLDHLADFEEPSYPREHRRLKRKAFGILRLYFKTEKMKSLGGLRGLISRPLRTQLQHGFCQT